MAVLAVVLVAVLAVVLVADLEMVLVAVLTVVLVAVLAAVQILGSEGSEVPTALLIFLPLPCSAFKAPQPRASPGLSGREGLISRGGGGAMGCGEGA